ncbi:hypothetical protein [Actinomycetospora cinnamomea]|uniref:Uncharacterized protein n=1 Tax=Actinomycetospora cinnamomea TaxID=663609 RepID=A0A2U1FAA4_9PSEU|nr:hypothetical protein [Actinomycetospora cinnamomea]PVZ09115.1 hypothetical protein C8D89_107279 [Actinomycetospora cinnamomea]
MADPLGRPHTPTRPVEVAGAEVYTPRDHVIVELTSAEAAVVLHAPVSAREQPDAEVRLSTTDRAALARATQKLTETVRAQLSVGGVG